MTKEKLIFLAKKGCVKLISNKKEFIKTNFTCILCDRTGNNGYWLEVTNMDGSLDKIPVGETCIVKKLGMELPNKQSGTIINKPDVKKDNAPNIGVQRMRGLSVQFLNDLETKKLKGFLSAVKNDDTLCLEIRLNTVNIYYRGGSLCKIEPRSNGYRKIFDKRYAKTEDDKRIIAEIKNWSDSEWVDNIPKLKKIMDNNWIKSNKTLEKEYQQEILTENNRRTVSETAEYYVADIEYQKENFRFDMIAVRKKDLRMAIIEIKYGDGSLTGESGIIKHVKDWAHFLSDYDKWDTLRYEAENLLNQKWCLGLLKSERKKNFKISAVRPELVILIVNHNPQSSVLERELKKVYNDLPEYKTLCKLGCEIKIMDIPSTECMLRKKQMALIGKYLGESTISSVIYRGTREIGGTLIELNSNKTRMLLDAGYPLFLNGNPIDDKISRLPSGELLEMGVLPPIEGLYKWDTPKFDAIIISHAHLDHYGLLKYIHPNISVYLSAGTKKLIEITQLFKICESYPINAQLFKMYEPFIIGDFIIKPFLIDHSAFDAAAFEIITEGKTVIYSGDFRGHGRKSGCLDNFIKNTKKQADVLFTEGSMISRSDEKTITEDELEISIFDELKNKKGIVLFQTSSQNIDRLVSFYRAALRLSKTFVVDVYTANILYELNALGNNIPYPSCEKIKVFFPYCLTQKVFNEIGSEYAKRFSAYHMPKDKLEMIQNEVVMLVRPSMQKDLERCNLSGGTFFYSMWQGYRGIEYQKKFENWLDAVGFDKVFLHTSGHAKVSDIRRIIDELNPKKIIPIHTLTPDAFLKYSDNVELKNDGIIFEI